MAHHVSSCFLRYPNHPKRSSSWDGFDSGPFACMLTDGLPQVGCIAMGNHSGNHGQVMAIQRRQPTSPRLRGIWKAKRDHQPCGHMRPWGFLPSDIIGGSALGAETLNAHETWRRGHGSDSRPLGGTMDLGNFFVLTIHFGLICRQIQFRPTTIYIYIIKYIYILIYKDMQAYVSIYIYMYIYISIYKPIFTNNGFGQSWKVMTSKIGWFCSRMDPLWLFSVGMFRCIEPSLGSKSGYLNRRYTAAKPVKALGVQWTHRRHLNFSKVDHFEPPNAI